MDAQSSRSNVTPTLLVDECPNGHRCAVWLTLSVDLPSEVVTNDVRSHQNGCMTAVAGLLVVGPRRGTAVAALPHTAWFAGCAAVSPVVLGSSLRLTRRS